METVNVFWFRRDLRLKDNAGLYYALRSGKPVMPIFIFDKNILDDLEENADARLTFIREVLVEMQQELEKISSSLHVFYGTPENVFKELLSKKKIENVFTNHDYEPYATERDSSIKELLQKNNCDLHSFKDQVIFEKNEVLKDDGTPYTVFTPYSRKWKAKLKDFYLKAYPTEKYFDNFFKHKPIAIPSLKSIGFKEIEKHFPSKSLKKELLKKYADQRDYPAIDGTSRLGIHLRFGTISIRRLATYANDLSATYLNELIWRDFYQMILWHFPRVGKGHAFKADYEKIEWRKDNGEFDRWCSGQTGYPIVDAGMRELNETGFMHNRVRMIVASFLAKHLLLDWRLGEAYFAVKLLDFDLAANNGGWQWAAGSGCDAAPYFRVFNPYLQTKKFDAKMEYIKKWVPEYLDYEYPKPIVEHEFARRRCLEAYSKALKKS